ncbi:CvpA family protein [Blattabacterium cuenoti]|uniref:CvpA family protein n=1 Tax=Blattabacterium cuenoti TaxID=1653831 RepID=UPI00163BED9A|nr:CvpA family protein [Blattabacterium cuenoti]
MTFIDILILILVLYGGFCGYKNGLISQLFVPTIFIFSLYKGLYIFHVTKNILRIFFNINDKTYFSHFLFIIVSFIFIVFIVFLLKRIIQFIVTIIYMDYLNKLGGFILGVIKNFLYISLFIFFFKKINKKMNLVSDIFLDSFLEEKFQLFLYKKSSLIIFLLNKLKKLLFVFNI